MSSIIKSIIIAFSMYSKIPMPQFKWEEKDMKYIMCFFPFVGVIIGVLVYGFGFLADKYEIGNLLYTAIGGVIPIILTGGIHIDGYMDVIDSLSSYGSREKKLEILKDPHIGAFSMIGLLVYYLIYLGAFSEVGGSAALIMLGIGFYLARVLSAICVVCFRCAKGDGLVYLFSSKANIKLTRVILFLQLVICTAVLTYMFGILGLVFLVGNLMMLIYYRWKCYKEFGGITGDTAGFFVTLCEGINVVIVAGYCVLELL